MIITAGSTNVSVYFYIVQDAGATSPGEPVTGLLFSDIETGGSASYMRQGVARTDFTLVTLASASAAHTDGGFILADDTNMPGLYRCDVPDAAFVTGVAQLAIQLVVASAKNAVVAPLLIDITDVDLRDSVRGGMTALPAIAAGSAGGLPDDTDANGAVRVVDGTGSREINTNAGAITLVDTCTTNTDMRGTDNALPAASAPTNFGDLSITATTGLVTLAGVTHTGAVIPTVTTLTGHTAQTGDSFARIGANGASLTTIPWNAAWDPEVESECNGALVALNLDHLLKVAVTNADVVDDSVFAMLVSDSITATWIDLSGDRPNNSLAGQSSNIAVIEGQTDDIGVAGAGLTGLGGMSLGMKAEVQQECTDAIAAASVYHADIQLSKDGANTQDEYTVRWFKDDSPVTPAVSPVPQVQVINDVGADLVAATNMTQVGATGAYKLAEATNRITAGQVYEVVVTATIDSSVRTWKQLVSRDSA